MKCNISLDYINTHGSQTIYDEYKNKYIIKKTDLYQVTDAFTDTYTIIDKFRSTTSGNITYLVPTYQILIDDYVTCTINKETILKNRVIIAHTDYGEILIKGNYSKNNYSMYLNGYKICQVKKKLFSNKNSYSIEIKAQEAALIIAITLVVNELIRNGNTNNSQK